MRFFMLYSNQFATGNKPIGIASLAAILKREGHQFRLFDCTNYSINVERKFDWNLAGARNLAFKYPSNPERLPERRDIDYHGLVEELLRDIDGFKPDIIGLSALTDDYPLGLGLMREVKRTFPDIPTIAGGIHATVDPGGVIAEECFDSVCVGEGEYVVLDVADRIDSKNSLEGIANLWIKRDDGMVQSKEVRPYEQKLDLFPFPDWSIYGETAFYKPFNGVVYKYDDFEMSRGCPYKCSYCINVQLQGLSVPLYAGKTCLGMEEINKKFPYSGCNVTQIKPILDWQFNVLDLMNTTAGFKRAHNGAFIISCYKHVAGQASAFWYETKVRGVSMHDAAWQWWQSVPDVNSSEKNEAVEDSSSSSSFGPNTYIDCLRTMDNAPTSYECNPTCANGKKLDDEDDGLLGWF